MSIRTKKDKMKKAEMKKKKEQRLLLAVDNYKQQLKVWEERGQNQTVSKKPAILAVAKRYDVSRNTLTRRINGGAFQTGKPTYLTAQEEKQLK